MALIHGRPFLSFLIDQVASFGIRNVVLCTGFEASKVSSVLGDQYETVRLHYSEEKKPLGTGGALRAAAPFMFSDLVMVLNGDSFCRTDLGAFRAFHNRECAKCSILLAKVDDTARYGQISLDEHGRVLEFSEKGSSTGPGMINAGIYLMTRQQVFEIPPDREVSLEREIFPKWIGRGLAGFLGSHEFLDIGTPESFAQAEQFFSKQVLS